MRIGFATVDPIMPYVSGSVAYMQLAVKGGMLEKKRTHLLKQGQWLVSLLMLIL